MYTFEDKEYLVHLLSVIDSQLLAIDRSPRHLHVTVQFKRMKRPLKLLRSDTEARINGLDI